MDFCSKTRFDFVQRACAKKKLFESASLADEFFFGDRNQIVSFTKNTGKS